MVARLRSKTNPKPKKSVPTTPADTTAIPSTPNTTETPSTPTRSSKRLVEAKSPVAESKEPSRVEPKGTRKSRVSKSNRAPKVSQERYDVEEIRSYKKTMDQERYFVKWLSYPESENTWESSRNIGGRTMIKEFHNRLGEEGTWYFCTFESGESSAPEWNPLAETHSLVCEVAYQTWLQAPCADVLTFRHNTVDCAIDFESMTFHDGNDPSGQTVLIKRVVKTA
eukprot:TRINITY_DN7390_c0_g1_i1.p1 TRINITY_DN7390_c0_g1~~TRINITY_DN7390_c0_g1_i1.p1  ORF type:complete len:224 (-),score=35.90 TRINITY_DN7390_c0_g1_i1:455-1126(-)